AALKPTVAAPLPTPATSADGAPMGDEANALKNLKPGGAAERFFERRREKKAAEEQAAAASAQPTDAAPPGPATFIGDDLPEQPGNTKPLDAPAPGASGKAAGAASLKRILNDDIESEMEKALAGFESEKLMTPDAPKQKEPPPKAVPGSRPGRPQKVEDRRTVTVVAVRGNDVFVDLGGKSEGVVSAMQFEEPPTLGQTLELIVDHLDEANGLYVLRRPGQAQEANWGTVAKGMIVDAHVKAVNKGGLEITVNGLRGFMPAGQVSLDHIADFSGLVGQILRCEVTEANVADRNLVVSRRHVLEQERAEKATELRSKLEPGQIHFGVVKSLKDYGAFVDIGGLDGLLHVRQLSWSKVERPSDVLRVGQEVKVVVLEYDRETDKISLGLKQLSESPWDRIAEKYSPGAVVVGKV
ncbi:MAG: 30S ribosomal protein S1, partial [Planctomycetia bacterium]